MKRYEYIEKSSVNRPKFKKEILIAMVECAQNIREYYPDSSGLYFEVNALCSEEFKPGVADRLLFSRIIDDDWDRILDIYCCSALSARMIGFGLMVEQYYPRYGTFRKMSQVKKNKRRQQFRLSLKAKK